MSNEDSELLLAILNIQEKIENAPALNMTFTKLIEKVDKINVDQELVKRDINHLKTVYDNVDKNVSSINESLHHPKTGLFSEFQSICESHENYKKNVINKIVEIDEKVEDLSEIITKEHETIIDPIVKTVSVQQKEIESIEKWKDTTAKSYRSLMFFFGTGIIGIIFKIVYDVIAANY